MSARGSGYGTYYVETAALRVVCPQCGERLPWTPQDEPTIDDLIGLAKQHSSKHGLGLPDRGRCPECGRTIGVRRDGTIGPHGIAGMWPPTRCPGWRQYPVTQQ